MLALVRQARILAVARARGAVRIGELTRRFGVSEPTIRRDLSALADRGLVNRVHGGALPVEKSTAVPTGQAPRVRRPQRLHRYRLAGLAPVAVSLVAPGTAVGLSAGPLTTAIARLLRDVPELTVVTPSLDAAGCLRDCPGTEVILVGGVRTTGGGHVGPLAVATLRQVNLDAAFVEAYGLSESAGFTALDEPTAQVDRALLEAAHRRVVVTDHRAADRVGPARFATLDEVDVVVTGAGIPAGIRSALVARVPRVIAARS